MKGAHLTEVFMSKDVTPQMNVNFTTPSKPHISQVTIFLP